MFEKGDVVMITGTDSVFSNLLGAFGIVKETSNFKTLVLFNARIRGKGSMAHTVLNTELVKVGESDFNFD